MTKPAAVDEKLRQMVQALMEFHGEMNATEQDFVTRMARICENGYGVVSPAQRQWVVDLCVRYET